MPVPAPFVMGNPPDDPGCDLLGYLYFPDPVIWGPGPYPGKVGTRSGGMENGGPNESDKVFAGVQGTPRSGFVQNGYICMFFDVRLMKGVIDGEGGAGLPGQTTDGRFDQQGEDFKIGVRYMRNHPLCNGFVGGAGGSGSGFLGLYNIATATGVDRLDEFTCLSGPTDWGARTADELRNSHFGTVATSYNNNVIPHGDLALLTAQSPVALMDATAVPIYIANGMNESMPFNQYEEMVAVLTSLGTVFQGHVNIVNNGAQHSFGTWPENSAAAIAFTNAAYAAWNGGGGGGGKLQPRGLYNLLPAPDGFIGDITGKPFLTNPNIVGCRARLRWNVIQPTSAAVYDWSQIDNALALCKANGKLMGLSVAAGVGTPAWAYSSPTVNQVAIPLDDQTIEGGDHMPAFWEAGFMAKWQTFVTAMAAKYEPDPFIAYVALTGFMQAVSLYFLNDDIGLAACDLIAQADGYADTEEAFTVNAKLIIDMFRAAFPTTSIILTVDDPFSDTNNRGPRTRAAIENYCRAFGDQFGTLFNGLAARLPPHDPPGPEDLHTYPAIGQPIHDSKWRDGIYQGQVQPDPYPLPPQPLEDCLLHGWSLGDSVIEVYQSDVNDTDPAAQAVLKEANDLIIGDGGGGDPPPPPFISNFIPTDGRPGDHFAIHGGNFTGTTSVLIGGVASGTFTVLSDTNIDVEVSDGAVTGPLTVITPDGQGVSQNIFTILPPVPNEEIPTVRSPILKYPIGGRPPVRKTKPDPPRNVIVNVSGIAGDTTAIASWSAPLSDGGSPITNYGGRVNPGPGGVGIHGPDDLTADISGLPLDSDQTFTVFAINDYGFSDEVSFDFRTNSSVVVPPPVTEPRGVFRLLEINPTTLFPIWDLTTTFWNKAYIDGSRYEARWDKLVPAYDAITGIYTYDWADLDGYLDKCDTFGKKAIISIANGIYAPQWLKTLAAFKAGGSYQESGPDAGIMAYPWGNTAEKFWFDFLKIIGVRLSTRTNIAAIVATGFGQTVDTILSQNTTDTAKLTLNATHFRFASAADAWLDAAERGLTTYNSAFLRSVFVLTSLELPVPVGVPVKDGEQALDDLSAYVLTTLRSRMGFMCRGITAITLGPNPFIPAPKKIELVFDNSGTGFSAGYRLLTVSTDVSLDPSQDPGSYDATLAFTRAITKASDLQGKFVEIFAADADNPAVGYVTAMTNAQTALALNP